tara:strand:+ start:189 stop:620 length:432 start_codon:yes stop_codon:yes gene_type:complete
MLYHQGNDITSHQVQEGEPFAQEGYALMGAVFEVYNEQGFGVGEEIYQESLELELAHREISYSAKPKIQCFYKIHSLKKRYIPDLIVFKEIVVELKAVTGLNKDHAGQLMNYLRLTKSPIGYLINFGRSGGVEWKRFILSEYL